MSAGGPRRAAAQLSSASGPSSCTGVAGPDCSPGASTSPRSIDSSDAAPAHVRPGGGVAVTRFLLQYVGHFGGDLGAEV